MTLLCKWQMRERYKKTMSGCFDDGSHGFANKSVSWVFWCIGSGRTHHFFLPLCSNNRKWINGNGRQRFQELFHLEFEKSLLVCTFSGSKIAQDQRRFSTWNGSIRSTVCETGETNKVPAKRPAKKVVGAWEILVWSCKRVRNNSTYYIVLFLCVLADNHMWDQGKCPWEASSLEEVRST